MKISLITVCFNSVETIHSAIESVLSQTYENIEYIIVDGKSTDGTVDLIANYKLRITENFPNIDFKFISEKDNGLYDAMNKGIRMATGDVIGIINSDDLFCDNDAMNKISSIFKLNENIDAVYANLYYVDKNDVSKIVRKWICGTQAAFKKGWHPAHPTLYVRKNVYDKYGLFDLSFNLAADFEIMLRFFERYKISAYYLSDFLIKMRLGGTTNKNIKNIYKQNIECIRAFKQNNLKVNKVLYPIYRLLPKLLQYK